MCSYRRLQLGILMLTSVGFIFTGIQLVLQCMRLLRHVTLKRRICSMPNSTLFDQCSAQNTPVNLGDFNAFLGLVISCVMCTNQVPGILVLSF